MNKRKIRKLINRLKKMPDEKFNMGSLYSEFTEKGAPVGFGYRLPSKFTSADQFLKHCGTAACLAGHVFLMEGLSYGDDWVDAANILELELHKAEDMFMPLNYDEDVHQRKGYYTRAAAIDMLERFLETGKVEWRV